jgi:hypothetical protein
MGGFTCPGIEKRPTGHRKIVLRSITLLVKRIVRAHQRTCSARRRRTQVTHVAQHCGTAPFDARAMPTAIERLRAALHGAHQRGAVRRLGPRHARGGMTARSWHAIRVLRAAIGSHWRGFGRFGLGFRSDRCGRRDRTGWRRCGSGIRFDLGW